jgi:hypothetical protein
MKSALKVPLLAVLFLLPISAAHAQAPSVSPISDISINAGASATVNVVAVDLNGDAITLTSSVPAFATLNAPTTGTGTVVTTLTLAPTAGDVGTFTGSVKATAGGESDSTIFHITVAAEGSNQAPVVTAPALVAGSEGANLTFTVTAADADADAIASLSASGLPTGASFASNGTYTSGTFSWTPDLTQAGDYDVVFTATSGLLTGAATTHIHVENTTELSIAAINDVTLAEGSSVTVDVNVTGPDSGTIELTPSLPAFAGLNAPTSSTGTGTLATTITISPPTGTTGTFQASVTATAGGQTDTEDFTITVTPVGGGGGGTGATATLLGAFNTNRKFICFRVQPVDGSFDPRNVDLSSVTLNFGGSSIAALAGKTHVTLDCDDDAEGDHDDDCVTGDCDDDDEGECDDCPSDTLNCEAGLHACFSMSDVEGLFGDATLPGSLVDATVNGTLTTGGGFVATIGGKFAGEKGLHSKVRPNPLNPTTKLTFRLSQPGRVRVHVYDLQGRLVKTLLDANRPAGDQSLTWDGSNSRSATVPSGVYFFRIQAPQGEEVQRVTVLK